MTDSDAQTGNTGSDAEVAGLDLLLDIARRKQAIVAFTGAGISTESGIPDYRGPNGVWATRSPPALGDFRTNPETRRAYWEGRFERYPALAASLPNEGHHALSRLRRAGLLTHVITQNIDGLHQDSGIESDRVIELHGTARQVNCLDCGRRWEADVIQQRQVDGEMVPECRVCGGPLRAATVLFGEALPEGAIERSLEIARSCDLMLAIGSSLIVQPAAKIPLVASRSGAALAIVNLSETPLDPIAGVVVRGPSGIVLTALADHLTG
jgi:NAD-dependent deacetylase